MASDGGMDREEERMEGGVRTWEERGEQRLESGSV